MNHKNESKAEQLRECINSGQVSAAQVVAHAESGEVTTGWPAGLLQDDSKGLSKALSRDPNARTLVREAVAHQEAGEYGWRTECLKAEAALAAERAEVARLREALNAMLTHMGMDEDEWNKPTFDQARAALGSGS